MVISENINTTRQQRRRDPAATWGLVPTMGYLHEGHLSLVERASAENQHVAVSIFVNPTQFAAGEDLSTYPTNLARDFALLEAAGVDLVFTPTPAIMYPQHFQTSVAVAEVTKPLEGASRPTHFSGVTTVVAKLFNIVQPTRAYFGQKDAQQVAVLQRMVADLNFNLELVVCPIVREPDGLAMSSRNSYLSAEQRTAATVLSRTLFVAEQQLNDGERDADKLREMMVEMISAEPHASIDYISIADPVTLLELTTVTTGALMSMAVYIGKTRLIDNVRWFPQTP